MFVFVVLSCSFLVLSDSFSIWHCRLVFLSMDIVVVVGAKGVGTGIVIGIVLDCNSRSMSR